MTNIRDILNNVKWSSDKDIKKVEIWYIHRGAPGNIKTIPGEEITSIGKSFLETKTAAIPYHRIIKIVYEDKVLFDRFKL